MTEVFARLILRSWESLDDAGSVVAVRYVLFYALEESVVVVVVTVTVKVVATVAFQLFRAVEQLVVQLLKFWPVTKPLWSCSVELFPGRALLVQLSLHFLATGMVGILSVVVWVVGGPWTFREVAARWIGLHYLHVR